MRLVIQRVRRASVAVDGREVATIGTGLLTLVGFSSQDTPGHNLSRMARRLIQLRIFDDPHGRLNRSLEEVQGDLLLIPQITLTASLRKGTRPSFHTAASQDTARTLFESFVHTARALYPRVSCGSFQSHMLVSLENDGPVTFVLETDPEAPPAS